jgi:hypothetical protein
LKVVGGVNEAIIIFSQSSDTDEAIKDQPREINNNKSHTL